MTHFFPRQYYLISPISFEHKYIMLILTFPSPPSPQFPYWFYNILYLKERKSTEYRSSKISLKKPCIIAIGEQEINETRYMKAKEEQDIHHKNKCRPSITAAFYHIKQTYKPFIHTTVCLLSSTGILHRCFPKYERKTTFSPCDVITWYTI